MDKGLMDKVCSHAVAWVFGLIIGIVATLTLGGCIKHVVVPCPQYILIMQVQSQNQGQYQIEFDLPAGMTNKYFQIQMEGETNFKYFFGSNGNISQVGDFPTNIMGKYLNSFWNSNNSFKLKK